jgi:hypothetical protein
MLYIDVTVANRVTSVLWYVGQDLPLASDDIMHVVEIQASDDELMYILNNFTNIPRHNTKRVHRWYGTDAQFIVGNITTR